MNKKILLTVIPAIMMLATMLAIPTPAFAQSDCFFQHSYTGCDIQACEDIVCGMDPWCCEISWNGICVSEAEAYCVDDGTIPTGAIIPPGSGSPPIIKAKWETPDNADPSHVIPGTQVLPPMTYQGVTTVTYCAVVTDPNGYDNLDRTYVDVWHPDGTFKYQVELFPLFDLCPEDSEGISLAISQILDAYNQGLITFNQGYDLQDLIDEVEQCSAKVFCGDADLDYHQMCGEGDWPYLVSAYAFDKENGKSEELLNPLDYICVAGIELDFDSIDFEEVMISSDKWVEGDYVWDEPGEGSPACALSPDCRPPTLRNTGNVPAKIWVWFDDMSFGKTLEEWNVEFDARLDLDNVVYFDPESWTELPGVLDLCTTDKISFSIHVYKADPDSKHEGTSLIEPTAVPLPFWT